MNNQDKIIKDIKRMWNIDGGGWWGKTLQFFKNYPEQIDGGTKRGVLIHGLISDEELCNRKFCRKYKFIISPVINGVYVMPKDLY